MIGEGLETEEEDADELTSEGAGVARVGPHVPVTPGEKMTFAVETESLQFFDRDSGEAIWNGAGAHAGSPAGASARARAASV